MQVDIKTLLLVQVMTIGIAMTVMSLLYFRHRGTPGPGWWVAGAIAAIVHIVLMLSRAAVPDWWFAQVGNAFAVLSYGLFYNGMRRFCGRPPDLLLPVVLVLLSFTSDILAPPFERLQARGVVVSLLLGIASAANGWALTQGRHHTGETGRRFTALMWALNALVFFGRSVLCMVDASAADYMTAQVGSGVMLLWSILFAFGMATGPVLMTSERLAEDLATRSRDLEREVEERRNTQKRLAESEAQFRRLIEAAPFPILMLHPPQGTILYVNRLTSTLLNTPGESLLGRSISDFYRRPHDRTALLDEILARGIVLDREFLARDASGRDLVLLVSAVRLPFRGQDCIMACASDITARKHLEQALSLARDEAEAALETQKRAMTEQRNFLAMVSHEFRTPLSIIDASAEVLAVRQPETGDRVARIKRAVQRMQGLIETCLAHEWLETAAQVRRLEPIDLAALLTRLAEEATALHSDLNLRLSLPAPLPTIQGDGTLLSVVFSNLIENAIKYSPPGSPITIEAEAEALTVTVRVRDQGMGITPEEQERLFEKFYRSTRAERKSGAGLGLYLARRVLIAHRGDIAVTSRTPTQDNPASGTTFSVYLPLPSEATTTPAADLSGQSSAVA